MAVMAKKKPKLQPTPFGVRLKALRRAAGLSQLELAAAIGSGRVTIARLETSPEANPTLDTIRILAEALGCTVSDLVSDDAE